MGRRHVIIKVHVHVPFRLTCAAAPPMRIKAEPGKHPVNRGIINVSSVSGLHGSFGQADYAAAKFAILDFTIMVLPSCRKRGKRVAIPT
jgi:3-oxoacyl-[acyl-carrier protein] reductase